MLTAPNSSFSYDGAGNRRAKTVNGVNTRYVLSILGMSQVLMETNSSNAAQNYYVYGPTGLLYRVKPDNTTYSYYHYDYRGSTTAITNQAQTVTHSYSYDPFGKVLAKTEADANPFQYVGQHGVQYESPTLTFMRARYYDPTIGRFLSEDPIWALNLYPYADNNPVMRIDPEGNVSIKINKNLLDYAWSRIQDFVEGKVNEGVDIAVVTKMLVFYTERLYYFNNMISKSSDSKEIAKFQKYQAVYLMSMIRYAAVNALSMSINEVVEASIDSLNDGYAIGGVFQNGYKGEKLISDDQKEKITGKIEKWTEKTVNFSLDGWQEIINILYPKK